MPAEKTQPFCPCSRFLNWTGKGLTKIQVQYSLHYSDSESEGTTCVFGQEV